MQLLFATHNNHKAEEVRAILSSAFEVITLREMGDHVEVPETGDTLEANALQKARTIYARHGLNCFADDTGLEVEALQGAPGVYSARYAGPQQDSVANVAKLLTALQGVEHRAARFRTVIALVLDGQEYLFEGEVHGEITQERHGAEGFGYDPIFRPEGSSLTFAEMPAEEKNRISHRYRATQALADFLLSR